MIQKFIYILLLITILYFSITFIIREYEPFLTGAPLNTGDSAPNYRLMGFRDTSLRSDVIEDRPRPPDIGYTGKVIYSPVDLASDISKIKRDIINSEMKEKNRVTLQITNAVPVEVGKALETWKNCPLLDTMYGK